MKISLRQVALLIMAIFLAGCEILPTPADSPPANTPAVAETPDAASLRVFFTAPGERDVAGAFEEALLRSIDGAQQGIQVAMYNFSLGSIADGLIAAAQRGVDVRVVLDSDAMDGQAAQRMLAGGVQVIGDRRESLMHNKFVVVDGREVWTGSLNLTGSGLNNDNNNMLQIESEVLAKLYGDEFAEMFDLDVFGGGAPIPAGEGVVDVDGVEVEVFFSPDDRPSTRLVELVEEAQQEVAFLAYTFTLNDLRQAMLSAHQAGLSVHGVFDESQSTATGGEFQTLRDAGLDVRLDGSDGLMHDKVIILDGETVILGSYNFTRSADESNDENLLIVHDAGIAQQYLAEFARIFAQAQ